MSEPWYQQYIRQLEKTRKQNKKELDEKNIKIKELKSKVTDLENQLKEMAKAKTSKKPKFANANYSLKTQEVKKWEWVLIHAERYNNVWRKSKSQRIEKDQACTIEYVYPKNINQSKCIFSHQRLITRLINGKKEMILYRIFKEKWTNNTWKIEWVLKWSEYWIEIVITLAFMIYSLQLSIDQAKQILEFFCDIKIWRSEIDSLLSQLSNNWEKEYDTIADIILISLVVYIDETWWKVWKDHCYAWMFKTLSHTLALYWKNRSEDILDSILPRWEYKWTAITDFYKVYEWYFSSMQKCWAHFLRDAIKLTLLYPYNTEYKDFFEEFFAVFIEWKQLKVEFENKNYTLTHDQKAIKVEILKNKISSICSKSDTKLNKDTTKDQRNYVNLQKRIMKSNIGENSLFTFILIKNVEPTSNKVEQALRNTAKARNNYQTSKTESWAKKRSIITTVIESLKWNIQDFSFKTVIAEVIKWWEEWISLFQKQLQYLQFNLSP